MAMVASIASSSDDGHRRIAIIAIRPDRDPAMTANPARGKGRGKLPRLSLPHAIRYTARRRAARDYGDLLRCPQQGVPAPATTTAERLALCQEQFGGSAMRSVKSAEWNHVLATVP